MDTSLQRSCTTILLQHNGRNFLVNRNEEAVFGDGGSCKLYIRKRVDEVLASPEYKEAREKYYALAEKRRSAAIKSQETREHNHREMMEHRAAELASFNGKIYIANFEYKYGWERWGVLAKDEISARKLFKELLASSDMKEVERENFDYAKEEYKFRLSCYRDDRKKMIEKLEFWDVIEPIKPLRKEFKFQISEIVGATDDDRMILEKNHVILDIEEAEYVDSGGGWTHNLYPE